MEGDAEFYKAISVVKTLLKESRFVRALDHSSVSEAVRNMPGED